MPGLPPPGTRVAIRYHRPRGSVPPTTDVVGHLVEVDPALSVRTKAGDVVEIAAADVVSLRVVPEIPVRNPDIRRLEHAAAMAWPGVEQHWLDGWLCRAGGGSTYRANSAVPLGVSAKLDAVPAIVEWYRRRGLTPKLAVPDRLVRLPSGVAGERETLVMVAPATASDRNRCLMSPAQRLQPTVTLSPVPDAEWLRLYRRDVPVAVLTAVVDGEVVFAARAGAGVGRGAVTVAPDGTRWAGLSAVHVVADQRGRGHARALCAALLCWAAERRAIRAYVQVRTDNGPAIALYESLGFTAHHRSRYVAAAAAARRV
jgi:N-acetylglutamate synthase